MKAGENLLRDDLVPQGVANLGEMQAVFLEQVWHGFAVLAEHGRCGVEVVKVRVLLAELADGFVGAPHPRPELPAFEARFDREEGEVGIGKFGAHFGCKGLVVSHHLSGAFAVVDVVIAGVEKDGTGFVGEHDAVEVVDRVGEFGAPKSAVEGGEIRKRLLEIPATNAGASDEENEILGWRGRLVLRLEGLDGRLPIFRFGADSGHESEKENGSDSAGWHGAKLS